MNSKNVNSIIERARRFAEKAHRGTNRNDGSPYITHPLAVADVIREWGFDDNTVAAALLHDVIEDAGITYEKLKNEFGEDVAFLVQSMTKLEAVKYKSGEPTKLTQAENIRKFIVAISEDLRVVFIKLADRLHNMRTLGSLPHSKQIRIAAETYEIYAALAYRLGMHNLSGELEDLAFPYLYPKEHRWLVENVSEKYDERQKYAARIKPVLERMLRQGGIASPNVDARAKRYASLYKKLKKYDMDINRVYDLVALRVIVRDITDCYGALGVIHSKWPPVPGRFKDYIALPKPNGYRSLHTTVFCEENRITEIQIRTGEMHKEAELGAAAHVVYKGNVKKWQDISWIQKMREWGSYFNDPEDFLRFVKTDFLKDRIFVITPKQDVIDLPAGATPVDFAYRIHTDVGNQCSGARVNGKIAPLNCELESGDVVEIFTQKGKNPSSSWLEFVRTSMARSHIKSALRKKRL